MSPCQEERTRWGKNDTVILTWEDCQFGEGKDKWECQTTIQMLKCFFKYYIQNSRRKTNLEKRIYIVKVTRENCKCLKFSLIGCNWKDTVEWISERTRKKWQKSIGNVQNFPKYIIEKRKYLHLFPLFCRFWSAFPPTYMKTKKKKKKKVTSPTSLDACLSTITTKRCVVDRRVTR